MLTSSAAHVQASMCSVGMVASHSSMHGYCMWCMHEDKSSVTCLVLVLLVLLALGLSTCLCRRFATIT